MNLPLNPLVDILPLQNCVVPSSNSLFVILFDIHIRYWLRCQPAGLNLPHVLL